MSAYIIHYRDGSKEKVTTLVGTSQLDGPNGAKGWHADGKFINRDDVLIIRDRRYPVGFDAIWDARGPR